MRIRDATPDDAEAACGVLRRSIVELCVGDHGNDPSILATWLRNKTPEIVAGWAKQPGNSLLLAVEGDVVLGVGSVTDAPGQYTFWDYQAGAWQKNHGLRIDHLLLSPHAADRVVACDIDKRPRAKDRASDHTPIWCELAV